MKILYIIVAIISTNMNVLPAKNISIPIQSHNGHIYLPAIIDGIPTKLSVDLNIEGIWLPSSSPHYSYDCKLTLTCGEQLYPCIINNTNTTYRIAFISLEGTKFHVGQIKAYIVDFWPYSDNGILGVGNNRNSSIPEYLRKYMFNEVVSLSPYYLSLIHI